MIWTGYIVGFARAQTLASGYFMALLLPSYLTYKEYYVSSIAQLQTAGGLKGFDKVVWDVVERKSECPSITFQYHSKDGEEGTITN